MTCLRGHQRISLLSEMAPFRPWSRFEKLFALRPCNHVIKSKRLVNHMQDILNIPSFTLGCGDWAWSVDAKEWRCLVLVVVRCNFPSTCYWQTPENPNGRKTALQKMSNGLPGARVKNSGWDVRREAIVLKLNRFWWRSKLPLTRVVEHVSPAHSPISTI